jgi:alpha-galactosidase
MSTRIVLIGAGSAQFGFDMLGDVFQSEVLSDAHVVLHDIDAEALDRVLAAGTSFVKEHELAVTLSATTDRKKALAGADFCVIAIEVGDRFALWEQDRTIPQQYGFRQIFGENGGPGGLFHSLRIVPPILEICCDIAAICPDAWVFNYSNPMSRICTTVHRALPGLKLVGLCHEIASMYQHLPVLLEQPMSNIAFRAGGLNHFSVLVECSLRDSGEDAYPLVRERAPAYFERQLDIGTILKRVFEAGADGGSSPAEDARPWAERGVFRVLLERFGVLPITTDSHIGEYLQWAHDVADHEAILNFYTFYKKWTLRGDPEIKKTRSERLVRIVEGIITNQRYEEAAVNVRNDGRIAALPDWIAVEVPGWVDGHGVEGIALDMPKGFGAVLSNQAAVHDLTADAVLSGSKDVALQALLVDPVVDKVDAAREMLDTMISLQPEYLGYLT